MNLFEAIILGIIQGLTEFLPVSSSGHIELGKVILGVKPKDPLLFSVVVHAATALSTIVVYAKDIWNLIKGLFEFSWNESTRFVALIVLSMIPVGIVGVFFEEQVEVLFNEQIVLVGAMLLVTAGLLWFSSRPREQSGHISFLKAFIIGVAQAIAILPGISRSGATISTALILGVSREQAARFSFLMVLPPILGATLLKVKKYTETSGAAEAVQTVADSAAVEVGPIALVAGFVAAFISGLLACSWMIKIVKNAKLWYFAIYCLVVGLLAIGWGLFAA
ncbi:MAG: undecaprenyl-diphosphate phosphatase [Bacteroidota bacterium]